MSRLPFPLVVLLLSTALSAQEGAVQRMDDAAFGVFDNDLLSAEFHRGRREALRELLPNRGVAVLFANPERNRSNDVDFEYHQDPSFYYLTGLREPNALLLVFKEPRTIDGREVKELLVLQDRDPRMELWNGYRIGVDGALQVLGVEHAMTGAHFLELELGLDEDDALFVRRIEENLTEDPRDPADLAGLLGRFDGLDLPVKPAHDQQLNDWLAGLREVKLAEELDLMRRAITITCEAQEALMRALEPDMTEYQTEAIVEYVFKRNGAEHEGFPSIQGGGGHSCVLHYVTNRRTLGDGDLLVSDIGAEYHGYTADVTRTLPVNGRFTPEQRLIYDLVLRAQEAGIAEVKAGAPFFAAHKAATAVVAAGLMELGLIDTESEVRRYFMHGTSHYLGLDVHDAGTYGPLRPNTVITVEPGIYIAEGSPCDPKWWDIGVRIEDDVLVLEDGNEVLSACVPRTAEAVEAMMAQEASELPGR